MLRSADGREREAAEGAEGAEGLESHRQPILRATARHHPHHVPILRARLLHAARYHLRRRCRSQQGRRPAR